MVKIELKISDNRIFQDIAVFLDSPPFQRYLTKWTNTASNQKVLLDDLRDLIKKYRYPTQYIDMLVSAVTKHNIIDKEVSNHYLNAFLFLLTEGRTEKFYFTKDELVISIFANRIKGNKKTILKEIDRALNQALIRTEPLPENHPLMQDVKPSIREMRDIYWEKLLNKRPTKFLAEKYKKEENTINKQITEYRTLLKGFL